MTPPMETRHSLIVKLQNPKGEQAWREFVSIYEGFLQRLARRNGVPERHIADVIQQILMVVARSIQQWQDDGNAASFRRWLATVARTAAIRFMSREAKQIGAVGGSEILVRLESIPDLPDSTSIERYEHEVILWAAEQVKHEFLPSSWSAFWATLVEGRDVNQVARELGVSCGSVYMSRSRILARIRSKIQEVEGE